MAIFDDDRYPRLSSTLNIVFAAQLPVIFSLSLILNPLVFIYNRSRKRGIAATLFQLQAVFDFLTNVYQPIILTIALAGTESKIRCQWITAVLAPLVQTASLITSLMSVARCIKIISPFYPIRTSVLVVYSVVMVLGLALGYTLALVTASALRWDPYIQLVVWNSGEGAVDLWMACLTIPYLVHTLLAVVATMVTVRHLHRKSPRIPRDTLHRRGIVTVVIMNIGNFTLFICSLFYYCLKLTDGVSLVYKVSKFLSLGYLPFLISALNPLVVATRSRGFWPGTRNGGTVPTDSVVTIPLPNLTRAMRGVVGVTAVAVHKPV
eukprot:sb/3466833/